MAIASNLKTKTMVELIAEEKRLEQALKRVRKEMLLRKATVQKPTKARIKNPPSDDSYMQLANFIMKGTTKN